MAHTYYDVVILGAGINGAGLFRDLCEQGVRCLLVDKGDFGGGTSAAPSRLIHGGLKYLETGELRLVAESTHERNRLLRNAPHLVRPLPTTLPAFSWVRGSWAALRTLLGTTRAPRSRGALLIKVGLALYDFYGARERTMPRHRMLSRRRIRRLIPALTSRVVAAGSYYDAQVTAPERLVLELIDDGQTAQPASRASNWTQLAGREGGTLSFRTAQGEVMAATPRMVINAAGPWIDHVNAALGTPTSYIGGTKGSHILLAHDELLRQLDGRMIYFEADDGRICLIFPYNGRALVGSTDIPADDPDAVRCEDEEVAYFMESLRRLLPGLEFDPGQIVYRYSGIRPLPASDAVTPGLISRDHSSPTLSAVEGRPFPIISLVGGKWTTFRAFAEEVADRVLAELGHPRKRSTRGLPIGGGRDYPVTPAARSRWLKTNAQETGLDPKRLSTLLERYGSRAAAIAAHEAAAGESRAIEDGADHSVAEIDWLVRNEHVGHLEDIVLRRTQLAVTGRLTHRGLTRIADTAGEALGWDDTRRNEEIRRVLDDLERRHGAVLRGQSCEESR
jgi:glycerol-3-phosphate dehydrogenase